MYSAIVCFTLKDNAIGNGNRLLFDIKDDLARFKKITENKIVIMGSKTFYSIGKILPNRKNIVLSSKGYVDYRGEQKSAIIVDDNTLLYVVKSIEELEQLELTGEQIIIGGAQIYNLFANKINKIYATVITETTNPYEADTFLSTRYMDKILTAKKLYVSGFGNTKDCYYAYIDAEC